MLLFRKSPPKEEPQEKAVEARSPHFESPEAKKHTEDDLPSIHVVKEWWKEGKGQDVWTKEAGRRT